MISVISAVPIEGKIKPDRARKTDKTRATFLFDRCAGVVSVIEMRANTKKSSLE
jgi:hypothetical protein